jgi:hypothetical protein
MLMVSSSDASSSSRCSVVTHVQQPSEARCQAEWQHACGAFGCGLLRQEAPNAAALPGSYGQLACRTASRPAQLTGGHHLLSDCLRQRDICAACCCPERTVRSGQNQPRICRVVAGDQNREQ